jgi:signal transduction histidine kinase
MVFLVFVSLSTNAQERYADSLKRALRSASTDSIRYDLNISLSNFYEEKNLDSSLYYAEQSVSIARRTNQKLAEAAALNSKAYQLLSIAKYGESLKCLMEAMAITEDPGSEKGNWSFNSSVGPEKRRLTILSVTHHMYALLMNNTQNTYEEIFHYKEEIRISEMIDRKSGLQLASMNLGATYFRLNKPDSALLYAKRAEAMSELSGFKYYHGWTLGTLGDIYLKKKNESLAKQYYHKAIQNSKEQNNLGSLSSNYYKITRYFLSKNDADSSLYYAKKEIEAVQSLGGSSNVKAYLAFTYENLYAAYILNNKFDSAFKYQGLALVTKDSVHKDEIKNLAEFQHLTFSEQLRLRNVEKEKTDFQNRIRTYLFLAGIGILLLLSIVFYRNNRQKHKANLKIEKAYNDLKETQQQLVQSEKMASLGEMTAGIAHEIQNPLNFVNNFSELNKELLEEMQVEINTGNSKAVRSIAGDVIENEKKILHHGKRADAIVKSMLQHSRNNTGIKELSDINALCDEYLRLSYHGLRAKDKSFNAKFETNFDSSIEKINVVPQELGRVILNLINNAFYAVSEKKKQLGTGFEPTITVSTRKVKDQVEIKVKDNGHGMSQTVLDKIFQPFFTTKPAGQGTGLGLSLSYDIVKSHGGEIKVDTRKGEGTEFLILLPINAN